MTELAERCHLALPPLSHGWATLLAPPTPQAVTQKPTESAAPETQRALIEILEELLEITGVDPEDNFFALGGDSIISIKWSAQANARGLAMTPPMVFEYLTIAELAGHTEGVTCIAFSL